MGISIKTFEPVNGINSEEYRAALLMEIQEIKYRTEEYRQEYRKVTSETPTIIAAFGGLIVAIFIFAMLVDGNFDGSPAGIIFGFVALVGGVFVRADNNKRREQVEYLIRCNDDKLNEAQNAYSYAYTHKDKDGRAIYEDGESILRGKKLYE